MFPEPDILHCAAHATSEPGAAGCGGSVVTIAVGEDLEATKGTNLMLKLMVTCEDNSESYSKGHCARQG